MKKIIKKIYSLRRGDDLVSLSISIAISAVMIAMVSTVMTNAFIFNANINESSQRAQDIRNVFGVLNRYSSKSSSISTETLSWSSVVIFDNKTKIGLTWSWCENFWTWYTRFEYIYNTSLPNIEGVGLTNCYNNVSVSTSSLYQNFDPKIMRYKIILWNTIYYNTISAKN